MITKHNFDRNQKCTTCGITQRESIMLQSKFCYMVQCDKSTYQEVQIDRLIYPLRDLGVKMIKNVYTHHT